MFARSHVYRAMAVPACIVWGFVELIALQRARRLRNHP